MSDHFDIFSEKIAIVCIAIARAKKSGNARAKISSALKHAERFSDAFVLIDNNCKSPIEKQLASALIFIEILGKSRLYFVEEISDSLQLVPDVFSYISPQAKIGKYIADFLIVTTIGGFSEYIIIECDGHDFHEKTKQQAAHDKKRDRYFTQNGYKVLRFTGSEIYNDVDECVREIDQLIQVCFKSTQEKHLKSSEAA